MKLNPIVWIRPNDNELIATFGVARLVWWPSARSGRHELIGGTPDDLAEAREWCSLYAHDLVFSSAPRHHCAMAFAE